jgi:16S rRNA (guanine527-N7)-methyltransferase
VGVSPRAFRDQLSRRLEKADAPRLSSEQMARAEAYVDLLRRWNEKINLTSLPLDPLTDDAVDRLLVEPVAAARQLGRFDGDWIDLGSGGGSPAVPLRIAGLEAPLTMVESKTRKVAFLREVIRALGLTQANVESERADVLAASRSGSAQLVTVRAVRLDAAFVRTVAQLVKLGGCFATFSPAPPRPIAGFDPPQISQLIGGRPSYLGLYSRTFHVEQSD